jgi:tetratricopeptide (TPR) repeat protein
MSTPPSVILDRFQDIESNDYYQIIRYYQRYSLDILALEEKEYHFMQYRYAQALFETGAYEAMLTEIDPLIEYVFLENVEYEPVKTFESLLYYKARALHNTLQYEKADQVARQLYSIEPTNKTYANLLQAIVRERMSEGDSSTRLFAIILIFGSAIISAIYYLMKLKTGYEPRGVISLIILTSPCLLALAVLTFSYLRGHLMGHLLLKEIRDAKKIK